MEKWKIAAIVALLAALPAYSYFAGPQGTQPETPPTTDPEEEKQAPPPPAHLQTWWGKKPPSFSFPQNLWTNTNKPIKLEELKGKVVLLELWRANCSHCRHAVPMIESYATEFKSQGFTVVGIHCSAEKGTIEYDWPQLKKSITKFGIHYPVAFDEKRAVFNLFKAQKFPTFLLIDRQGTIRYAHEGMTLPLKNELRAAIEQVLSGKNPVWPPTKAQNAEGSVAKSEPQQQ